MKTIDLKTSKKIAMALLACGAALTAKADYPSTVLSQGPVGYWRLNETTSPPPPVQATNSGSLGTADNAFYVGDSPRGLTGPLTGGNGKAVSFDGSSQAVQANYDPALNPASFSIEAWLQPKSASVSGGLLCALASMHSASPRSGWLIYQSDTNGVGNGWNLRLYNQNGTATSASVLGATNMTAGVWYHVVATYDGPSLAAKVYVNGVLTGQATATGFVPNPDSLFSIGARSDDGFLWPGEAAEVAYYSSAISASKVLAHYQAATTNAAGYGTQVIGDGPIAYYRFLEPAEPTAVNLGSLGAAANGTIIYNAMPDQPGPVAPTYPGFTPPNTSVSFDGNSGYVRIPPLNLNSANVSMTAWVNLNGNTDNPNAGIVFCDSGATQAGLKFDETNPNGLSYNWSSATAASFNSGFTIPASGWAFLALITYPDHAVLAIQDGSSFQFATNLTTLGALPFSGFTLIGSDGGATNLTFLGSIDEVAIFNRSLGLGEVYSEYAAAAGGLAPTVFLDPQAPAGTVFAGDTLNLSVDAGGTPLLTYFWRKTGATVQSGTASTFNIASLATTDSGNYDCIVSNSFGSVTSAVASITVNPVSAPSLVQGPVGETVYQGGTISLNVQVTGGDMSFYWSLGANAIAGATSSAFVVPSAVGTNAGSYTVLCSNRVSTLVAGPAVVNVIVPAAGTYAATVLSNNPEAWWRLNDTSGTVMTDSMGRHPGTYNGGITLGVPGLPFGSTTAASFDGENGASKTYASVPYSPILNSENFTVEAWVQTADQTTDMGVLSSFTSATSSPYKGKGYFMHRTTADSFEGDIGINDMYAYYYVTMGPNIQNKWTQVGMQFGGPTSLTFFQDGAISASGFADFVRNTSSPFLIGYVDPGFLDFAWNGTIADVAYYTTALTPAQMNAHYQAALYGNSTAPFFTVQPISQTVVVGSTVTFTAHAEGTAPIGYQWLKNNVAIASATNASLTLSNVFFTDGASYVAQATNSAGSTNSTPGVLTVLPVPYFVDATNGLVLHLKFDGDSLDYSGRGNNGTNSPTSGTAVAPVYVAGKIGSQAIQFTTATSGNVSGNSVTSASYVELGSPPDLEFSSNVNFSVSMWVQLPVGASPGDLPFIGNTAGSTGGAGYLMAPSYKSGSWGWSLGDLSGDVVRVAGAANDINDGAWHNLIFTFDRTGNGTTYVDGTQVDATPDAAGGDVDSGYETVLGQDPTFVYPEPATFAIDDVGVWRRLLTSYEAYSISYVGNKYGLSFDQTARVGLTIQKVTGGYGIVWQAGQLESSTVLTTNNASWTPVAGASAPFYQFTPGPGPKFFRVHP